MSGLDKKFPYKKFPNKKPPEFLIKPFLKWAGGKRALLPEIRKQFPGDISRFTYYEPFLGAGAVFFDLRPERAVINDCNSQLILTYRIIKEKVEDLIALLGEYQNRNNAADYYALRDLDRDAAEFSRLTDTQRAARLIFLNKTCFNGLYRVNAQGCFNVPYGKYRRPAICEAEVLRRISAYLNTHEITLRTGDFEEAVSDAGALSFIYFDPPYHSPDKTNFTGYQAEAFGEGEQRRLRDLMVRLTRRGVKCLLSNSDTEYIRSLYGEEPFVTAQVLTKRSISADVSLRGSVSEVLIRNWKD
ncbi:MAG: Dam family site-specific DNA-(adenine-N6)-methyltransferase [Spirochaetaceae bacterium]|jgi:DNA adenine methylase|nr:Dam family site-specific DNA-(adenine-N6)-methyltransferase [Spirochaetaceae bacterium]